MSDSFVDYLRKELRKNPDNAWAQRMLVLERRRLEARGTRDYPPIRTQERVGKQLRVGLHQRSKHVNTDYTTPIDDEVRTLVRDKIIVANESGLPSLHSIHQAAREAVYDGCVWGDYYALYKLRQQPAIRANAKLIQADTRDLIGRIDDYLAAHSSTLLHGQFTRPPQPAGVQIEKIVSALTALEEVLNLAKALPMDSGGRPGDPWKVGFVFGVSLGWVGLTSLRITESSRFLSFVAQGGSTVHPDGDFLSDSWASAVRTAIRTFGLTSDGRSWLTRPGDPPRPTKPTP